MWTWQCEQYAEVKERARGIQEEMGRGMEELSASVMRQLSHVVGKMESDKREAEDGRRKEMAERKRLHNQVSSFSQLRQSASGSTMR